MDYLSPETVEKFKQAFKRKYGVEYSDSEAREAAHNLLGFFELLLKVDRRQNPDNYTNKQNSE